MTIRDMNAAKESVYWDKIKVARSTRTGDLVVSVDNARDYFLEKVYPKGERVSADTVSIDVHTFITGLADLVSGVAKFKVEDFLANEKGAEEKFKL